MEDISGIMALYSQCAVGQHAVLYLHPGNLLQRADWLPAWILNEWDTFVKAHFL